MAVSVKQSDFDRAVEIIPAGGVVAIPTETYYGLAADPFNSGSLRKLFRAKNRPIEKPILTLINGIEQLPLLAESVPSVYEKIMERFWPGPLTLIFPACQGLPHLLTGGTSTIGVRISSHSVPQKLIKALNKPITATSANLSGHPAAISAAEVEKDMGGKIDFILDGGVTEGCSGSTIIGYENGRLKLIRKGKISFDDILLGAD